MSAVPRIRRAVVDQNDVLRAEQPIPVTAGLRWYEGKRWGQPRPVDALALAWSHAAKAVEIQWDANGCVRTAQASTTRPLVTIFSSRAHKPAGQTSESVSRIRCETTRA
jgi:hypothetical protein